MATRRNNAGSSSSSSNNNNEICSTDMLIKSKLEEIPIYHRNFSPYNKNRRLISRRVATIGLTIFMLIITVSIFSIIVKIDSNIPTTKDSTSIITTRQSLLNNSVPKIIKEKRNSGDGNTKRYNDDAEVDKNKKMVKTTRSVNSQNNDLIISKKSLTTTTTKKKKKEEKPLEIYMTFEDPPIFEAPIIDQMIQDFDPVENAVIVTKIQGEPHLRALRQMLCLLTKAYNNRVNYDIIVFTSESINKTTVIELQTIVSPSKLIVEIDNPGLQNMVDNLSESQKTQLFERCGNVTSSSALSWYTECSEVTSKTILKGERIAYNWQAEFRALWLWTHPLLKPYKYMMWMDSDVFCTRIWNQDPIATTKRHDLVLLFDHFPQGAAQGSEFPAITREVFNRTICGVDLVNGALIAKDGRCFGNNKSRIKQVHGFFHVSNLDFYRSDAVMKWNRALIGESKFSRLFDDQIGITIPAAVLAGNRSRDMRSIGVYTRVFHNYVIDGEMKDWRGYYVPWWEKNANTTFPEASEQCFVDISA